MRQKSLGYTFPNNSSHTEKYFDTLTKLSASEDEDIVVDHGGIYVVLCTNMDETEDNHI